MPCFFSEEQIQRQLAYIAPVQVRFVNLGYDR